jgi:hypothetical protein
MFAYLLQLNSLLLAASRALAGWQNPLMSCYAASLGPVYALAATPLVTSFITQVFNLSSTTAVSLSVRSPQWPVWERLFAAQLRFFSEVVLNYGQDHIIVQRIYDVAATLSVPKETLRVWCDAVKDDFELNNMGRVRVEQPNAVFEACIELSRMLKQSAEDIMASQYKLQMQIRELQGSVASSHQLLQALQKQHTKESAETSKLLGKLATQLGQLLQQRSPMALLGSPSTHSSIDAHVSTAALSESASVATSLPAPPETTSSSTTPLVPAPATPPATAKPSLSSVLQQAPGAAAYDLPEAGTVKKFTLIALVSAYFNNHLKDATVWRAFLRGPKNASLKSSFKYVLDAVMIVATADHSISLQLFAVPKPAVLSADFAQWERNRTVLLAKIRDAFVHDVTSREAAAFPAHSFKSIETVKATGLETRLRDLAKKEASLRSAGRPTLDTLKGALLCTSFIPP